MDPSKICLLEDCSSPIKDSDEQKAVYKNAAEDFKYYFKEKGGQIVKSIHAFDTR